MVNKWVSIITPITSKSIVISVIPLLWIEKSDNNYDEQEHGNELVMEGMNMPKKKYILSKEEIFFSAQELEAGSEYSEEEDVLKEIPGLPILETSEHCKRGDDEDAKYIVSKTDLSYSLSDEEDKEKVISVMPSSGTIRKSNRIKNPPSAKLDDFLWSI
jgi:hypothetical protein